MIIELTGASVVAACGGIVALGSAIKVVIEAKKALSKPHEEIEERLDRYNERISNIEKQQELTIEDSRQILLVLETSLSHFESGNNTGEVKQMRSELNKYIINRKIK